MDRRPHRTGGIPPTTSAFLPPLVRQRFPLYSFYGLARPMTARMVFPEIERLDMIFTANDKLCGNYHRADQKTEDAIRKVYDERLIAKKETPTDPTHKLALQLQFAPQVVYHQPFHPHRMMPGAEVDPVLTAGLNVAIHDDKHSGFEFSIVLQGSFNYSFIDPNKDDPNETIAGRRAWQGQLQLQAAYVFVNAFKVDGLNISILAQAAGALSYQYDPTARKDLTSASGTLVGGFQIAKSFGPGDNPPWSVGAQFTAGPNTGRTVDLTGTVFVQFSHDLLKF